MDGLAARDSSKPAPTMTRSAASRARSTVNHQSTSRLLSARDNLMARLVIEALSPLPTPLEAWGEGYSARGELSCLCPPQRDARQGRDEAAEAVAADLEVGELVVGRAGGGEQHDGLGSAGGVTRLGIARCARQRDIERAAALHGDLAGERRREVLARLADQIGPGDAREERLEAGDAALFRLAAQ